jgi:hypothetical protein
MKSPLQTHRKARLKGLFCARIKFLSKPKIPTIMPIEAPMPGIESERMQRLLMCPCPKEALTVRNEGDFISFSNALQGVLVLRKFGDDVDHQKFDEWFKEHSVQFRRAFDETIIRDPLYFADYPTIGGIPDDIWAEIEEKVYN